ncbi:MAG: 3-ketoacyl-ACP reductase [Rhodobacteraceae bacterium]|nr:3-ketoacyl-ACP reductase [Paracoccaceae bacterium]MCF8513792.1 3-ketoacyl-ACP reductase [Paracoccaceae bacterium]MCF8518036.1 3-ketoacyl-ACP reductase [Paracoccaceae bacterium]
MALQHDLHDRLDALGQKLTDAKAKLDFKNSLHDGHRLSNGELLARHAFLKAELDGDIADLQAHGKHISALEEDAMTWIKSVDLA